MSTSDKMDRRGFLRRTGQGVALAGLGMAMAQQAEARRAVSVVDPRAPKTGRLLNPDEVIGLGVIGIGGMGSAHLKDIFTREQFGDKVQLRALCDVYTRRRNRATAAAKEALNRSVDGYNDYKEILSRDDIHGVIIATPDHLHSQISIDAMRAGKDVYCQKPVTLTVEEALDVRDVVHETGRVFQCGAQYCSDDFYWKARAFIKEGGIGKVLFAQGEYSRNSKGGPDDRGGEWNYRIDDDATDNPSGGEGYIDWPRWLGPAPKRAFSKPRFFQFRKFWDYSGGVSTDLLYHFLTPLMIALDAPAPERVVGSGGIYIQKDDREVPDTFVATLDYPSEFTVVLTSVMGNRTGNDVMIRGHKATIRPDKTGMRVTAEKEFKEWFTERYGKDEIIVPYEKRPDHTANWLDAMRTRGSVNCDIETALRSMIGIKLACDSYRQERVMFWDAAKQKVVRKHPRPNRDSKIPTEKV